MFVANRYYNSPHIAGAAANLGDALFGSPQREYTRAQTEATQEQTEDRRIMRGRTQRQWEALLEAAGGFRGMGIETGAGEPDLAQAIAAARAGGGGAAAPSAPVPPAQLGLPDAFTPPGYENWAAMAAAQPSGAPGAPASVVAPAGGARQPETFYDILSQLTDRQPARITPQDPGAWLSEVMIAHGPQVAMGMLEAMQEGRNPYEQLGLTALLNEQGAELDYPRDLAMLDRRGAWSALDGYGGSGTRAPLDITPAEAQQIREQVWVRLTPGKRENAGLVFAITNLASQYYQGSRNAVEAVERAIAETPGLLDEDEGGWDWFGGGGKSENPWENY